jgi:hypothetical protein
MEAVRANVRQGNKVICLATEDMFIWGQVHTDTPFFFPNREALVNLYTEIVDTPGVEHHLLSHCTMAPFVVDPELIRQSNFLISLEAAATSTATNPSHSGFEEHQKCSDEL